MTAIFTLITVKWLTGARQGVRVVELAGNGTIGAVARISGGVDMSLVAKLVNVGLGTAKMSPAFVKERG